MKNKIIIIVSGVLLSIVIVGVIIANLNSGDEPTDDKLNNQYEAEEQRESTALHIDNIINNSGKIDNSINLKFVKDLGYTPESKIYAFKTADSSEDVSDLYADYIENQTGQRPDIYWIESTLDGELIYWYASDGILQSILY